MTTIPLKLTDVEGSVGALFSEEMLTHMQVKRGDTLFAVKTATGYLLTPTIQHSDDAAIEHQLQAGREVMRQYKDTLTKLAKS